MKYIYCYLKNFLQVLSRLEFINYGLQILMNNESSLVANIKFSLVLKNILTARPKYSHSAKCKSYKKCKEHKDFKVMSTKEEVKQNLINRSSKLIPRERERSGATFPVIHKAFRVYKH